MKWEFVVWEYLLSFTLYFDYLCVDLVKFYQFWCVCTKCDSVQLANNPPKFVFFRHLQKKKVEGEELKGKL